MGDYQDRAIGRVLRSWLVSLVACGALVVWAVEFGGFR
jgi:hypothetical protein